jgi:3-oxoacyl-[acyl-carrier-protein] synthase-1
MAARTQTSPGVVIGGIGMVASLGLDAPTVCAAARAGLVRPQTIDGYRIRSAVEGDEEPVIGYPATLLTAGFEGDARLIRLAQGALSDLLRHTPQIEWRTCRHKFYLALPDSHRVNRGEQLIMDSAAREALRERLEEDAPTPLVPEAVGMSIASKAAASAAWPTIPDVAFANLGGATGVMQAIQRASGDLSAGAIEVAVVLAVDSLLDERTLDWLNSCGRLKCDASPTGLRPGEAAVGLALRLGTGDAVEISTVGLGDMAFARDQRTFLGGSSPGGEGLAEVLRALRADETDRAPWLVTDQNGETYRSADWGFAVVRLRSGDAGFADPIVWYPAASLGDTGVAAPLVSICLAARAWERGYAPADIALVTASDDDEGRAGLALTFGGALQ